MKLDREVVLHIAQLAKVHLEAAELEALGAQLGDILEHFDVLNAVDTEGVEPTAQAFSLRNVMAEDEPGESMTQQQVLELAPRTEDGFLRVRAVLD